LPSEEEVGRPMPDADAHSADEAWVSARFCLSTNKGPNPEAGASAWEETVLTPHNRARESMTQFA
jgi:hypothetical protein